VRQRNKKASEDYNGERETKVSAREEFRNTKVKKASKSPDSSPLWHKWKGWEIVGDVWTGIPS
jgi:hypothetical protein